MKKILTLLIPFLSIIPTKAQEWSSATNGIYTNENVGIGTSNPSTTLQVNGKLSITKADNVNVHNIEPNVSVNGTERTLRFNHNSVTTKEGFEFFNQRLNSSLLFIQGDGKVGIGATSPNYKFDVVNNESTANTEYLLGAFRHTNGPGVYIGYVGNGSTASSGRLRTGGGINLALGTTNNTEAIVIENSTGHVGIGTNDPKTELQVNGKLTIAKDDSVIVHQMESGVNINGYERSMRFNHLSQASNEGFEFYNGISNKSLIFIQGTGRVGVGTTSPGYKFEVVGDEAVNNKEYLIGSFKNSGNNGGIYMGYVGNGTGAKAGRIRTGAGIDLELGTTNNLDAIVIENATGNVGIGANTIDAKLTVGGDIHSQEVRVTINAGADFVFEEDYALPKLEDLAAYVRENKHLPEIAPAAEMEVEGLELGQMNIKLLQKIEELTLYTIEQEKQIEILKNEREDFEQYKRLQDQEIAVQNKKLEILLKRLEALEQN